MEQLVAGHEDSNGCINYEGERRAGGRGVPRGGVPGGLSPVPKPSLTIISFLPPSVCETHLVRVKPQGYASSHPPSVTYLTFFSSLFFPHLIFFFFFFFYFLGGIFFSF